MISFIKPDFSKNFTRMGSQGWTLDPILILLLFSFKCVGTQTHVCHGVLVEARETLTGVILYFCPVCSGCVRLDARHPWAISLPLSLPTLRQKRLSSKLVFPTTNVLPDPDLCLSDMSVCLDDQVWTLCRFCTTVFL